MKWWKSSWTLTSRTSKSDNLPGILNVPSDLSCNYTNMSSQTSPQGWQSFVQKLTNSTYLHSIARLSDLTPLHCFFRWIIFILIDWKWNMFGVYSLLYSNIIILRFNETKAPGVAIKYRVNILLKTIHHCSYLSFAGWILSLTILKKSLLRKKKSIVSNWSSSANLYV